MNIDLYQFQDYRAYLKQEFPSSGEGRGRRQALAKFLNCQTSYISQVLTDRSHLSLEQAVRASNYLAHSKEERNFFLLLVQYAKAASAELKEIYLEEVQKWQKRRNNIQRRIGIKTELTSETQMKYYSAWYFAAVHILTAFDGYGSAEAIAMRLKLRIPLVKKALQFLVERGFVVRGKFGFEIGQSRIHLPQGSEMLPRHHANWRIKAIENSDQEKDSDLHYTAVLGISQGDAKRMKEQILKLLQEFEPIVKESPIQVPTVLLIDFFGL